MAFSKYADASVTTTSINMDRWESALHTVAKTSTTRVKRAAKVVMEKYDPKEYLLSHATIIASVDTEESSEPLGRHIVDGFEINRPYKDWLITPKTTALVNNNWDGWERKLLLSSFPTFVGGENYVEHLQIPELSKGKIIDAVARDIGDSIYVDILIATHRKHAALIKAILSGQLRTLSMGCQVEHTLCSKCGNRAADETQICSHIKYFKGSHWVDALGNKRIVAELCGHLNDEPGSVKFIEASWVANPAFKGAVVRSFLSPEEIEMIEHKMNVAFSQGPRIFLPGNGQRASRLIAARGPDVLVHVGAQGQGQAEPETPSTEDSGLFPGDSGGGAPEPPVKDPIEDAADSLAALIRERAVAKVRDEIGKGEATLSDPNQNNNLIKEAFKHPEWRAIALMIDRSVSRSIPQRNQRVASIVLGMILYKHGGWDAVRESKALTGREILSMVRFLESTKKVRSSGESQIYRTVIQSGGTTLYPSTDAYVAACRQIAGRNFTASETQSLVAKGRLYSMGVN